MKKMVVFGIIVMLLIINLLNVSASVVEDECVKVDIEPDPDDAPEHYAVIFIGRYLGTGPLGIPNLDDTHYKWYLNDAARMYNLLASDVYGYDDDHIFLLVKLLPEIDMFPIPALFQPIKDNGLIDYESSKDNLELVLNKFKPEGELELGEKDSLLLCVLDHGNVYSENNDDNTIGGINWLSPDSHESTDWLFEDNAYDDSTKTKTYFSENIDGYSDSLVLTLDDPIKLRGFRICANYPTIINNETNENRKPNVFDEMELNFYNQGDLVKTFTLGSWMDGFYDYQRFEGTEDEMPIADSVHIKFHEQNTIYGFERYSAKVLEFDFWPESNRQQHMTKSYIVCPFFSLIDYLKYLMGTGDVERIYDTDLGSFVDGIEANMVFMLQPCFSGGLIDDLSGPNRVICTASRGSEPADAWIGYFREALDIESGNAADSNGDGRISIKEAYEYAANCVYTKYGEQFHPLIDDNGNRRGSHINDATYDPETSGKDGYIASSTYLGAANLDPPGGGYKDIILRYLGRIYPRDPIVYSDYELGPIPMVPQAKTGSSDENKKPVFTNEITLDAIVDQDLTIKPYICNNQNVFGETELLVTDEYNIGFTRTLKWSPENRIITQSFIPDCNSIGAFGASVGFTGETAPSDDTPIPDVRISLFRDLNGVADVDNPLVSRVFTKDYCLDSWIGVGYDVDNSFIPIGPDGFMHLEDMSMSPIEISVTPGKTYYIGVEVLGSYPDDFCGGYTWGQTDDLYQDGRRRDLELVNDNWQWVRENTPYTIYKDMAFSVWGWDMLPEMPSDPLPSNSEAVEITTNTPETEETFEEYTGSIEGEGIGVFLSFSANDKDSVSPLKGLFYVDSNDNGEFTHAGTIQAANGRSELFFKDINKDGAQYKWTAALEDWGIIRATHEIWKFTTNPYTEDIDISLEEKKEG